MALNPLDARRSRRLADRNRHAVDAADATPPSLADPPGFWAHTGLNSEFLSDLLSTVLAHERGTAALYESGASRTRNPVLQQRYGEFGQQTRIHAAQLEALVTRLGGNPDHLSEGARATRRQVELALEATAPSEAELDLYVQELLMLDAIFSTETTGHSNWLFLAELAAELDAGPVRDLVEATVEQVEAEQDDHLQWVETTRARILLIQARRPLSSDAPFGMPVSSAQELDDQIEALFD